MKKIVDEVVDEVAYQQLDQLKLKLSDARKEFDSIFTSIKSMNDELKKGSDGYASSKIVRELQKANLDLSKSATELAKQNEILSRSEERKFKIQEQAAKLSVLQARQETELAKAKTESAKASEIEERAQRNANKETERTVSLKNKLKGEYKLLNDEYEKAATRFRDLAVSEGLFAKSTQEALAQATLMRKTLSSIDQALGDYRRNVGNYSSAFRGVGMNLQQVFRELPALAINLNTFILAISNNVPMLMDSIQDAKIEIRDSNKALAEAVLAARAKAEADALAAGASRSAANAAMMQAEADTIASSAAGKRMTVTGLLMKSLFSWQTLLVVGITLLTIYGGKISEWITELVKGKDALAYIKKEQEEFNKAQEQAYNQASNQIGKLRSLEAVLTSTTASVKAKRGSYEEMLRLYPSYNDQISEEYKRTGHLANVINNVLIPAIIAASKARAMQSRIDALTAQNLVRQDKQVAIGREQNKQEAELLRLQEENVKAGLDKNNGLAFQLMAVRGLKLDWREIQKEVQQANDLMNSYAKGIVVNQPKMGNLEFDGSDAGRGLKKDKKEKDHQNELDREVERERKAREEIEKIKMDSYVRMLKQSSEALGDESLRKKALDIEIGQDEKVKQEKLNKAKLTESEKLLILEQSEQAQAKLVSEYLDDISKIRDNKLKEFKKNLEETEKALKESEERKFQYQQRSLENEIKGKIDHLGVIARKEEQANLANYKKGLMSKESYERNKDAIQEKYLADSYTELVDYYMKALQLAGNDQELQKKFGAELEALQEQRNKRMLNSTLKAEEAKRRGIAETIKVASALFNELLAFGVDSAKNQIDELDRLAKAIDSYKDKQINAINETSLSEQEKAKRIKLIEAEAAQRNEQIEARKRQLLIQRAKVEKAQNVSSAIQAGAMAVLMALKTLPPPYSFIVAALSGALAGVQIARIIATPLPQYAKGRKGGPAEFAIVGEAGAERIEYSSGQSKIVDKPTVEFLPAGAKVIPNQELERERLRNITLGSMSIGSDGKLKDPDDELKKLIKDQTKAIKESKTELHVHRSWLGERASVKTAGRWNKWINDNI